MREVILNLTPLHGHRESSCEHLGMMFFGWGRKHDIGGDSSHRTNFPKKKIAIKVLDLADRRKSWGNYFRRNLKIVDITNQNVLLPVVRFGANSEFQIYHFLY